MLTNKIMIVTALITVFALSPVGAAAQPWDDARCEKFCTDKGNTGKHLGGCIQRRMYNHKDDASREAPYNRKKCATDKRAC